MSALSTNSILAATRRKLLEEGTDLVSDETLLMNVNLAYDELKIKTFTNDQIEKATISFVDGVGTLPANFGTAYGPGYKTATDRTPFNEKNIADFDRDLYDEAFTIEGGQIKVHPATTTQLIIKFWPKYDPLTATQDPELNEYLHEIIIYGAMWRILEDLQNEARSEYYREKTKELIKEKSNDLSNYQEENLEGVMLNGIRIL